MHKLLLLFLLSSCMTWGPSHGDYSKPLGYVFSYMPKCNQSEHFCKVYQQGWRDGCETGMATGFATTFYKSFYQFKKDQRFMGTAYNDNRDLFDGRQVGEDEKSVYSRVWGDTMKACRHEALGGLKNAGIIPKQAGQTSFEFHSMFGAGTGGAFGLDKLYGAGGGPYANW